jgi:Dihydrodipicolinate synthase/N-acetylneuraminate lyase
MRDGFITALGTPFDEDGKLVEESLIRHVEDQINAGASGLLVMGSMGIEPYIKDSEYGRIAKVAVKAAKGRCPVFIGVMDNSTARVIDRIKSLEGLEFDGVVTTTPYYNIVSQGDLVNFFTTIAKNSTYPVYLYDLPVVTKMKITTATAEELMKVKNIKGIKTGDIVTVRELMRSPGKRNDFTIMFSGLDIFDVAYKYGVRYNLDGMFSCTHKLGATMYSSLEIGDYEQAGICLDKILLLRNTMAGVGIFKGFTYAMNILGYKGIFSPDFAYKYDENDYYKVKDCMQKCGLV